MPRAFSSGAASIWSYALNSPPNRSAPTFVSAAVSVVLPWSTCPIVPTFTCGLVRSNFPFAMTYFLLAGCREAFRPRSKQCLETENNILDGDTRCTVVPMERIERSTSPLPRECSTTELHGRSRTANSQTLTAGISKHLPMFFNRPIGAGRFLERVKGIEPRRKLGRLLLYH